MPLRKIINALKKKLRDPDDGSIFLQRAVFLDRDGTLNADPDGYIARPEDFTLLPGVGEAVQRLNQAGYRTVVVTNQSGIARGLCTPEGLQRIHDKMEGLLAQAGAHLDRILYCPHHPDFTGPCACRKPEIGMILEGRRALNLDLAQSWIIGDTSTDILAGQRAGLRTILLETGHGGRDGKHNVQPDFVVPDLPSAVALILDGHTA